MRKLGSNRRANWRIMDEALRLAKAVLMTNQTVGSNCRMSSLDGFPRRRRPTQQRTVTQVRTTRLREPAPGEATREALDIARYVADMAAQLEAMSAAVDLDLLAYFLGMAKAEAELFLRTTTELSDDEEAAAR
jgi:hypothetical protein